MANNDEMRWRQRLEHFARSVAELVEGCQQDQYNKLERAGLIQLFELSFELAWKTLQDLIAYEGQVGGGGARTILREAHSLGLLSDIDGWLAMLEDRNRLSHAYDEETVIATVHAIRNRYQHQFKALLSALQQRQERE
jgi:nucleotidyltransferase substrate binding protein (TIGR01987 family)